MPHINIEVLGAVHPALSVFHCLKGKLISPDLCSVLIYLLAIRRHATRPAGGRRKNELYRVPVRRVNILGDIDMDGIALVKVKVRHPALRGIIQPVINLEVVSLKHARSSIEVYGDIAQLSSDAGALCFVGNRS